MFQSNILIFVLGTGFVLAKVTLPPELQDYVDELHNNCVKKSGITEDDHATYDMAHKDQKMMCYMKCLMLESQWMTPDGAIQYDFIKDTAHSCCKDLLVNALEKCHNIEEGADLCEKSYNFNYCMREADPENWFFV